MIRKNKNRVIRKLFKHKSLDVADVKKARKYIEDFWPHLRRDRHQEDDSSIGLPHPFLVPAYNEDSTFNFDEMYYWDSYFMVQGMLRDTKHKKLVMGMLDNQLSLVKRYKMVPNASRTYLMGRSQPPLLTSFIFDVYEAYSLDLRWLEQAIGYAKTEYENVWMGTKKPFDHKVHEDLSRYYDINLLHDLAEAESGWDMTTRFNRKCLDFLPIDLNCYLYKYEKDFAKAAHLLNQPKEAENWNRAALKRKHTVDELMWNKKRGMYFDYNYQKKRKGQVASLAAFTALWSGLADKKQAKELVSELSRFEFAGGLAVTEDVAIKQALPKKVPTQWAYPNGWAPLHFLVAKGLEDYGYHGVAERVVQKWLKNNLEWFNENGVFLEKYNVVNPKKEPTEGLYPSQTGFGWTNAVFERFCQDYIDK
jgi:alpha,alpha-trehalase